ncbi:MAG: hypothetical protein WCA36_20090 [Pseudolabrys sp.]|jgi:hypothetical protein
MNTKTAIAFAAAALLAGVTASAPSLAATHSTMTKSSKSNPAAHGLMLTKAQRKTAWNDLHGKAITQTPAAKFADKDGVKVPRSVAMMQMSSKAAHAVPALKPYDFTVAKGKLLIVNPKSRKIVDVISG